MPTIEISNTSYNQLKQRADILGLSLEEFVEQYIINEPAIPAFQQNLIEQHNRIMSSLSHEIRTPLTVVTNSAEILTRYKDRLSAERREERLYSIQHHIAEVTELLDEISSHSQIDYAFQTFTPSPTTIEPLCADVIKKVEAQFTDNHQLQVSLNSQDITAMLDSRLINHALSILIANAIKYSPQGGCITLEITCVENELRFKVSDEGVGIPEADYEILFTPFTRGSNVGSTRGIGIGLTIVQQIATLHNGYVDFHSTYGEGSTFIIGIPYVAP